MVRSSLFGCVVSVAAVWVGGLGGCANQAASGGHAAVQSSVVLTADTVNILGANARVAGTPSQEYLGYWTNTDTTALWSVKELAPGTYKAELLYALDASYAGSIVVVSAAGQTLTSRLAATKSWHDFERLDMGTLKVSKPGDLTLTVTPATKPRQYVMNLQQVILTPVKVPS